MSHLIEKGQFLLNCCLFQQDKFQRLYQLFFIICIYYQSRNMSLFLLSDQDLYFNVLPKCYSPQIQNQNLKSLTENALLASLLEGEIKKMGQVSPIFKKQNSQYIEYHYLSRIIQQRYNTVQCLRLNKQKSSIEMKLIFSKQQGTLFHIQNISNYVHIINQFTVRAEADQVRLVNMSINIKNGLVVARLPALYLFNHLKEMGASKMPNKLFQLFKYQIQQSTPLFERILTAKKIQKHYLGSSLEKDVIWASIYRYNQMINISSHLNESYLASQAEIRQNNRVKCNDIKKIIKNRKEMDSSILKNNLILQENTFIMDGIPQNQVDFQLTRQEQAYARFTIAMPPYQIIKNPPENNMILNYIHIKGNVNFPQINKNNEGGFASLYLTEIRCVYVFSSQDEEYIEKNKKQQNIHQINKFVLVKKSTTRDQQSRILHQIQILKEIKNGVAIFLPRYYLAINKGCFFSNVILMDYIPFSNLKQYLQSNSVTMSLMTKLVLIFSITQSLRYIRDYRIVHLDLKSANIMIYFNLLIKLIDFGESYHPTVCKEKHTPGYTIPYSPPEVYSHHQDIFTSKSDVYSLGVIIYEILYNHLPFRSSISTQANDEIMQNYLDRWYFMPQQLEARGQVKIIRLLNMLICKCLRPQAKDRPQLDWIALIIRQCFEIIN